MSVVAVIVADLSNGFSTKVVAHLAALFGINIAKLHFMMWNE